MKSNTSQDSLALLQTQNEALQAQLNKLKRTDHILNAILEGTAAATGDDFLKALVQQLAVALEAKYVFLGELTGDNQDQIKTLVHWQEGQFDENFQYDLLGSPCATVVNNKLQYYPEKTYELFPDDEPLVQQNIECYLGVPLFDSTGKGIGNIVVMHDEILEQIEDTIPIIGNFAARAAAELERRQNEITLYESEQRYRLLVEQSNDIFFLIYKGRFELVNNSFCTLFEVTSNTVYSDAFDLLELVHPSSRPHIKERLGKKYHAHMPSERFELMAQTISGTPVPVAISLSYLDYKEGTAVQGLLHDLTTQKLEEMRAKEQQKLTQALHEIGVAFNSSLKLDIILDLVLAHLGRIVPYDSANIILIDNGTTRIVRARGYEKLGINLDVESKPVSYQIEETSTWQIIINSKKPLVIPDITKFKGWLKPSHSRHIRSWASAPIIIDGEVVAFLSTNKSEPNFYTHHHGNRLAAFAAQAALAWQNANLFTAATERADALNATGNILRSLNAASNIQDALPILVNHLKELTGAVRVTIAQINPDSETLTFLGFHNDMTVQNPTQLIHLQDTAASTDIMNGRSHIVPDITTELNYRAANLLHQQGIRSYISIPLNGSNNPMGALTLSWLYTNGYQEEQQPFLQQVADAVALGMERSNLYSASTYRSQELNLLYKVISAATSNLSQEEILRIICYEIANFLDIQHITFSLFEESLSPSRSQPIFATIAAQHILEGDLNLLGKQLQYNPKSHILNELVSTQEPIIIDSIDAYPFSEHMHQLTSTYQLISALILPISLGQDLIGIVGIGAKEKRIFQDREIQLLQTVSEELGRVLEITDLYDQLRKHAAELEIRVVARTQELEEANEQLKELDKLKSRFVSDVSHELRTPVTNLKLYLDLLEHKGAESLNQYLPILQKQSDRLGQLIQDILDLSRLELGKVKLEFDSLNLNELITEVIVAHNPRAETKDLQLIFEPDPHLPVIEGVWNQLAQVVTNLIVNAINYSENGQVIIKTAVSQPQDSESIVSLEVIDQGIGISPDDFSHLFDRFYRGEQARQSNIPGTGLGLAIADEIVRIHNGRLEVESVEGEGSIFRVLLPAS